jgi:hypothetical protein
VLSRAVVELFGLVFGTPIYAADAVEERGVSVTQVAVFAGCARLRDPDGAIRPTLLALPTQQGCIVS